MTTSFSPPETQPRILLVAADSPFRESSATALRAAGYRSDCEADAEVAWQALCQRGYELLLIDQRLPRGSGLRLILRMNQAHLTLPVVLVIDAALRFDPQSHHRLDSLPVLAKPFGVERLLATVIAALQRAAASPPMQRRLLLSAGRDPLRRSRPRRGMSVATRRLVLAA